ncbi:MAG: sodium:solute symporter [Chthoniobacterales bacterium]|nr:sodium:solute symporter [Chthoniobacterales bacterium]
MSSLDYVVLISTLLIIAFYGWWKTRRDPDLGHYLTGDESIRWGTIGLSVMATQASAITFLSLPGQAYESGMGFVQIYFGLPFALIFICAFFIPIYHRLKVVTAYEFLGQRFDNKTRLLGAGLFMIQRGLAAGITIYAPAIIMSALLGWNLQLTILLAGIFVVIYTTAGGTKAVSLTQKWQMLVILLGMFVAFGMIIHRLPLSFGEALSVAGATGKLNAVDFTFDLNNRYTFWSGLLGGFFLSLSYFGTDQSQVQRYLAGGSVAGSRFGLLFNALLKIPMQFFILLIGVMVFVFYQFERPPVFFNQPAYQEAAAGEYAGTLAQLQQQHDTTFANQHVQLAAFARARQSGSQTEIDAASAALNNQQVQLRAIRDEVKKTLRASNPRFETKDSDYVFITFVLTYLPHGIIGLLVAVIFCAAMSSTASELNALGSTSVVDFYRPFVRRGGSETHYLFASKFFTALWGGVAIFFALFANLVENLIEAVNILGSIFYGSILGLFLVAFFVRWVRGTAVFIAALISQATVLVLFNTIEISYLWYNLIGCVLVLAISAVLQATVFRGPATAAGGGDD